MVEARDASLMDVGKARKGALIFARHMVEAGVVRGVRRVRSLKLVVHHVRGLPGGRLACVRHTVLWCKISVFMVEDQWRWHRHALNF